MVGTAGITTVTADAEVAAGVDSGEDAVVGAAGAVIGADEEARPTETQNRARAACLLLSRPLKASFHFTIYGFEDTSSI